MITCATPSIRLKTFVIILFYIVSCVTAYAKKDDKDYFSSRPTFFEDNLKHGKYSIDTGAKAIILYEKGTFFVSRTDNGRGYTFHKTVRRVEKILDRASASDADIEVHLLAPFGRMPVIEDVSGTTYKLEGGNVKTFEVRSKDIKQELIEGNIMVLKFSLPAVEAGSIIDYQYTAIEALNLDLGLWSFQSGIPKLYSEAVVIAPDKFNVNLVKHVAVPFEAIEEVPALLDTMFNACSYEEKNYYPGLTCKHWIRKNVPVFDPEPFTGNINNYTDKICFSIPTDYHSNTAPWVKMYDYMYGNTYLCGKLKNIDTLVINKAQQLAGSQSPAMKQATTIYNYIRDSISTTSYINYFAYRKFDSLIVNKKGNLGEKNLLLVAMLRQLSFGANPVYISRSENLKMTKLFPFLDRFNHLVCSVKISDSTYYLDASQKYAPFGTLRGDCYNGLAWPVNDSSAFVDISPSSIVNKNITIVKTVDNRLDNYTVSIKQYFTSLSGVFNRTRWHSDSAAIKKDVEALVATIPDAKLKDVKVYNLDNPDTVLVVESTVLLQWQGAHIYFTPVMIPDYNKNPFKSEKRNFPIELPFAQNSTYSMLLELPKGYAIDDTLSPKEYDIDDNNYYHYAVQYNKSSNSLSVNCKLCMKDTYFDSQNYSMLKDFFDKMLELNQTTILIKKEQ